MTVGIGFNLYDNSNGMEEYKDGFVVKFIDGRDNHIEFLNGIKIYAGDVIGRVSEEQLRRIQIRETILSHIERERQLFHKGINERDFSSELDANSDIAVYVKLPDSFYISTPVGHYNPDWAIAFYEGTVKHIYFVAETKGSMRSMQLRLIEESKIHCAREHFKAISGNNVIYDVVDSYKSLLEKVMK